MENNLRTMLQELKETQTRREDKQLDAAIKALDNGYSDRVVLAILNGQIKVDPGMLHDKSPAPEASNETILGRGV